MTGRERLFLALIFPVWIIGPLVIALLCGLWDGLLVVASMAVEIATGDRDRADRILSRQFGDWRRSEPLWKPPA